MERPSGEEVIKELDPFIHKVGQIFIPKSIFCHPGHPKELIFRKSSELTIEHSLKALERTSSLIEVLFFMGEDLGWGIIAMVKITKGNWVNEFQASQQRPISSRSLEMVQIYGTPKAYRLTKAQKTAKYTYTLP
ncbi:MAG: hypothetical protein ACK4LB_13995 [Spirosomataceae bacterium]